MIISSGEFRGFKLKTPKGLSTRPTSSKIREAAFNICRYKLSGSFFLDLYAGSGALGLEAISQGAIFTLFIESNKMAISSIRQNIAALKVEDKTKILRDVSDLKKTKLKFDIVYIDPPYKFYDEKNFFLKTLTILLPNLQEDALIFFEAPFLKNREIEVGSFRLESIRKYGDSSLVIFQL